jgi:mediator of RNA polymerase II transcription subunit 5
MLLQLAPTLVSQAISAAVSQIISIETLHSGLSFFSQPLLGWCQAGIIDWLCVEVQRQGFVCIAT